METPLILDVDLEASAQDGVEAVLGIGGASPEEALAAGAVVPSILVSPSLPAETPAPLSVTLTLTTTPEATATPVPPVQTYTVKKGDTLLVIARQHGTTVDAIIQANNLPSNGFIQINQQLIIPGSNQPAPPEPSPTPTGGTLIYRVAQGDTIASIAKRFGSTVEWMLQANNMQPTDILSVGQSVLVPLSNVTPAAPPTATPEPPTPMPTPGLPFHAPEPLGPGDGSELANSGDVLLTWTSVGLLGDDQWYVVTLTTPDGTAVVAPYWTKATSWRLPLDYREAAAPQVMAMGEPAEPATGQASVPEQAELVWQVQVVSGQPGKPGPALSAPSQTRRFYWH